ncbi:hypothetical protein DRE_06557 [Drechslerella stenobrocha 248]|uniref:Uncharacterized protein n=1 Tax=Drechslerella stenobrocha 248 TaxID=1043628 RepID=W7HKZ2_9PEZI|nr:hypothetical protein DRE_06557 [Drechslerella stenobrocha 248]
MDLLRQWIQRDLVHELQQLTQEMRQSRHERSEIAAKWTMSVGSKARNSGGLRFMLDYVDQHYQDKFVRPGDWSPPRYIESRCNEKSVYVQIIKMNGGPIEPGQSFEAVVGDGYVSIDAIFKVDTLGMRCDSDSVLSMVKPGAIVHITKHRFRFPGSCGNSWRDGITRQDQLEVARVGARGGCGKKPGGSSRNYYSTPAAVSAYRCVDELLNATKPSIEIEVFAILGGDDHIYGHLKPVRNLPEVRTGIEDFPALAISLPSPEQWSYTIIQRVARIWCAEVAWYKFLSTLDPRNTRNLSAIKDAFEKKFRPDGKFVSRVTRKARRDIIEPAYRRNGPISRLFEIRRVYMDIKRILECRPGSSSLHQATYIPGTRRIIPTNNPKAVPTSRREAFHASPSQEDMFLTQLPTTHRFSTTLTLNLDSSSPVPPDVQLQLQQFVHVEFDDAEKGNFCTIMRTLYDQVEQGQASGTRTRLFIHDHIADFYASLSLRESEVSEPDFYAMLYSPKPMVSKPHQLPPTKDHLLPLADLQDGRRPSSDRVATAPSASEPRLRQPQVDNDLPMADISSLDGRVLLIKDSGVRESTKSALKPTKQSSQTISPSSKPVPTVAPPPEPRLQGPSPVANSSPMPGMAVISQPKTVLKRPRVLKTPEELNQIIRRLEAKAEAEARTKKRRLETDEDMSGNNQRATEFPVPMDIDIEPSQTPRMAIQEHPAKRAPGKLPVQALSTSHAHKQALRPPSPQIRAMGARSPSSLSSAHLQEKSHSELGLGVGGGQHGVRDTEGYSVSRSKKQFHYREYEQSVSTARGGSYAHSSRPPSNPDEAFPKASFGPSATLADNKEGSGTVTAPPANPRPHPHPSIPTAERESHRHSSRSANGVGEGHFNNTPHQEAIPKALHKGESNTATEAPRHKPKSPTETATSPPRTCGEAKPVKIKVEEQFSDAVAEVGGPPPRVQPAVRETSPGPQDLLSRMQRLLAAMHAERERDQELPERARVPKDQAKALSKHSALWPPPSKDLQNQIRVQTQWTLKGESHKALEYPRDFRPIDDPIESSTESNARIPQRKSNTDAENPQPTADHAAAVASNAALQEYNTDDDDDGGQVEWEATPPERLRKPGAMGPGCVSDGSDDASLDHIPPPASSAEQAADRGSPPKYQPIRYPYPSSAPPSSPLSANGNDIRQAFQDPPKGEPADTRQPEDPSDSEVMGDNAATGDEADDDDGDEDDEGGEDEGQVHVQVMKTPSQPAPRDICTSPKSTSLDNGDAPSTPVIESTFQAGSPNASTTNPLNRKRHKVDEVTMPPARAGSAVSPMIAQKVKVLDMGGETTKGKNIRFLAPSDDEIRAAQEVDLVQQNRLDREAYLGLCKKTATESKVD